MKNKIIWALIVVVVIIIVIIYVGRGSNKDSNITIGVIAPLTGFAAEHGERMREGMELAKEKFGANNISLIYEDSACDPKKAISSFNKLTNQDGAQIIIGLVCSGDGLAISPLAKEKDVTVIAALTSSPDLTSAGEHFFRSYPSDATNADLMSNYVIDNNLSKVSIIAVNNDYGYGVLNRIKERISDRIVSVDLFGVAETDFRLILSKAKDSDIIFFIGYPNNTMVFLNQKSQLGITNKTVGSVASFTTDLFTADPSVVNNFLVSSPEINPNGRAKFVEEYNRKYQRDPAFPAEYGYDNFVATVSALDDADYNLADLREALLNLNVEGASGQISFDQNGDRTGIVLRIYSILNGGMVCDYNCQ